MELITYICGGAIVLIVLFSFIAALSGLDTEGPDIEASMSDADEVEEEDDPKKVIFHGTEDADYTDRVLAWPVKRMRRLASSPKKESVIKDPVRCPTCGKTASLSKGICPWCGGAVLSVAEALALKTGKTK